ncbi:MAG: adenylate/guanylate cyclase domain-containing protein [Actinomycetota bacterium]
MKVCPSCSTQNPDTARFCQSCGSSLVPACPVCGAERPQGGRFCPSCGTSLASDDVPVGQERRLVTILFADVSGSTALGERLDPERLQEVLAAYFQAMREEIEAEGGTVEKFIGDAVMAAFGVPVAHEDDPARALRAAVRMRRRLDEVNADLDARFGVRLAIRTGVNTGEVLAATEAKPGEPMVTGDAVNVAARLEQTAEPGSIVVAERTARAARGFRFRELGAQDLRGKDHAVPAVLLEDLAPERPERGVPGLRAPMVGREQELSLLRTLFERSAAEGRPNLVTIYGDPGVGKSRLTAEFLAETGRLETPPTVVRGRCLPYGEGITYWPMAEILKGLAGVRDTDTTEATLERILALGADLLTSDVASNPRKATAALAYTVGVRDPEFSFEAAEPREVRAKIHAAWRSLFSALAARSPVIAVVEDIHWADGVLLDLLEELADKVVGPALFLCPARPEVTKRRPGWGGGRGNVSSIALEPLSLEDADRLVGFLLAVEELPAGVHARILERAEGNPFFLEEIVRHLIDEGLIVREGNRWRASAAIGDVEIPDTVQGVLAARIDLLEPVEKRALQRAAVVGRVFWPGPVGRLLNGDRERLRETLDRLEDRELVRSRLTSTIAGEPEFIFKHILTRDVAYESLPRRDRATAHSAVAEWIESTTGERRDEFAELLAYHYEEAHRGQDEDPQRDLEAVERLRKKAFAALMRASENARRRFAVATAATMAARALSLARDPLERATAVEQVGMVALNDYRGDLAYASFGEAADLRTEHDPDDRMAIARVCARAVEIPMRWPGSMKHVPQEEEVRGYFDLGFSNVGDDDSEEHVRMLLGRSFVAYAFGPKRVIADDEYVQATEDAERAAAMAMRLGRPDLASASLDGASASMWPRGLYGPSLPIIRRRLQLAEVLEDPWELGDMYAVTAWVLALIGEYPEALQRATQGEAVAIGEAEGMALHNLSWRAFVEFSLGNWTTVVAQILPKVQAVLGDRGMDPPYFTAHAFGSAALIHGARGDPRAVELIALLRRNIEGKEEGEWPRISFIWLAWILIRQGSGDEALGLLEPLRSSHTELTRPLEDQVVALLLAQQGRWDEVPGFLARSREFTLRAGLRALPVHLDRLDGRAAFASGDIEDAVAKLERAREGFAGLGAAWERAVTELDLAQALAVSRRPDDARSIIEKADPDLRRAGALIELARLGALQSDLAGA